jgi:hypothetical protein
MELGTHTKFQGVKSALVRGGHYEYKEIKISTRNGWQVVWRPLAQVERHKDHLAERRARAHTHNRQHIKIKMIKSELKKNLGERSAAT